MFFVCDGDKMTPEELDEAVNAYFSAERGGQKLSPIVVGLLSEHYVKSVKIDDVKEVELLEVLENAGEAWEEVYEKALPLMRAREIESWIQASKVSAEAGPKSVTRAVPSTGILPPGAGGVDSDLFGDKGPTDRERAQLRDDEAAQRLTGAQIVQLSVAIELGSIPVLGDVMGVVRWRKEPKWGHHSFRRGADKVARATMAQTGATRDDIDEHFGWKQRERAEDMQLHYEGRRDRARRARVTMML